MSKFPHFPAVAVMLAAGLAFGCIDDPMDSGLLQPEVSFSKAGGGGGGGGEETPSNNLSVPTVMVGGIFPGVTCPGDLLKPTGEPETGFEVEGFYYVQGKHVWQAACATADGASTEASWGDNLSGDAKLKVSKPIRVELGLETSEFGPMDGFTVVKLQPSLLDRESAYGTQAQMAAGSGLWHAVATTFPSVRVYDAGVTFSVQNVATSDFVVPEGSNPTAEINATGKVVYGYNLRVPSAGEYDITFVMPSVGVTGVNFGNAPVCDVAQCSVTLRINVVNGGGGGGGPKGR